MMVSADLFRAVEEAGEVTEHRMFMAKLSPQVAKRMSLSANHHARVWCSCMADQISPGGYTVRPLRLVLSDPRRLGQWDALGVVDLRVVGSAVEMFHRHTATEAA